MHRQNNLMVLTRQHSADKSCTTCATGANMARLSEKYQNSNFVLLSQLVPLIEEKILATIWPSRSWVTPCVFWLKIYSNTVLFVSN